MGRGFGGAGLLRGRVCTTDRPPKATPPTARRRGHVGSQLPPLLSSQQEGTLLRTAGARPQRSGSGVKSSVCLRPWEGLARTPRVWLQVPVTAAPGGREAPCDSSNWETLSLAQRPCRQEDPATTLPESSSSRRVAGSRQAPLCQRARRVTETSEARP